MSQSPTNVNCYAGGFDLDGLQQWAALAPRPGSSKIRVKKYVTVLMPESWLKATSNGQHDRLAQRLRPEVPGRDLL